MKTIPASVYFFIIFVFNGAWLSKCLIIKLNQIEKSSSTLDDFAVKEVSPFWRSFMNTDSLNCLKQRYVVVVCSFLESKLENGQ